MEGIEARLLSTDDSTLDIKISMIENKGRGIVSKRAFSKGEFIVEYAGELISDEESKARWAVVELATKYWLLNCRESKYLQDTSKGSYMYWFKHKGTEYWYVSRNELIKLQLQIPRPSKSELEIHLDPTLTLKYY